MNDTLRLQTMLKALGFDPGPLDGQPGRRTQTATAAFQKSIGLAGGGIPGPKTWAALEEASRMTAPAAPSPPWVDLAETYLGLAEKSGAGSNPTIMGMVHKLGPHVGMDYRDDDTPWCGVFVGFVIATSLPAEPLPSIAVRAKSWASFGDKIDAADPARIPFGSIGVWTREGGGHVGFLVGWTPGWLYSLGGNQGNKVSVMKLAADRLIAARWPSTADRTTQLLPHMTGGQSSSNER